MSAGGAYPNGQSCTARKPRLGPPEEVRDRAPGSIAKGFGGATRDLIGGISVTIDVGHLIVDTGSNVAKDVPCSLEHQSIGVVEAKQQRRRGAAGKVGYPVELVEPKSGQRGGGGWHST